MQCQVQVVAPGMSFHRTRQCKCKAVTTGPLTDDADAKIGPVCAKHSPEAKARRAEKSKQAADRRCKNHYVYLTAKSLAARKRS